jgi:hypothetical protein
MLERYLTLSPESFGKFDKAHEPQTKDDEPLKEAYRYSKVPLPLPMNSSL